MSERESLLAAARSLVQTGNVGTAGNLSVRVPEGFLITPSGLPYERLEPEDLVLLDAEGLTLGPGQPSSEWRFHRDIYAARPEASAIVHCHSPHATALACLGRPIPAFHYEIAFAGGSDIRCAPYATFGTEALSRNVLEALEGRKATLMANHGMVCFGESLEQAMALAEVVEQLSLIYCQCLAIGEPEILGEDEMARVKEKFKSYGFRPDSDADH